jgi:hypothetical protein
MPTLHSASTQNNNATPSSMTPKVPITSPRILEHFPAPLLLDELIELLKVLKLPTVVLGLEPGPNVGVEVEFAWARLSASSAVVIVHQSNRSLLNG